MKTPACELCGSREVELILVTDTYVCAYCLRSFPNVTYPGVPRLINRSLNEVEKTVRGLTSNKKRYEEAKAHLYDMLVLLKSRLEIAGG
jgi:hypothetical protein